MVIQDNDEEVEIKEMRPECCFVNKHTSTFSVRDVYNCWDSQEKKKKKETQDKTAQHCNHNKYLNFPRCCLAFFFFFFFRCCCLCLGYAQILRLTIIPR